MILMILLFLFSLLIYFFNKVFVIENIVKKYILFVINHSFIIKIIIRIYEIIIIIIDITSMKSF